MDAINKSLSTLMFLIFLTAFGNSFGQSKLNTRGNQRVQFHFDKPVTLDSLTRYVHSRSKIRFSFNSSKVKGNKVIDLKKGTYSIEQLLQQIRNHTSLYYSMYNGYVIFQDNPPKQRIAPATDAKKNSIKPPVRKTAIASHHKPGPKPNNRTYNPTPARQVKPQPVAKKTQVDSSKLIHGSNVTADSTITSASIITPVDTATTGSRPAAQNPVPLLTVPGPPANEKKDNSNSFSTSPSAAPAKNSTTNSEGTNWRLQFGLQWKGALPLNGTKYYFTGINTRSQPYNLLVPGIWLSATANNKHEIMLLVKPAEWYFFNKKNFRTDSSIILQPRVDSVIRYDTIPVRTNDRLLKTNSWYGSLQYNYHINKNWVVGAGIGCHLLVRGLAYRQTNRIAGGQQLSDTLLSMKKDDVTGQYMATSFVTGKIEMAYSFGALDAGATLLMPITDPFANKSLNKSRPLNLQLFLRWRIKRNEDE